MLLCETLGICRLRLSALGAEKVDICFDCGVSEVPWCPSCKRRGRGTIHMKA